VSKEALIRDLKSKLEEAENVIEKEVGSGAGPAAAADIATLSAGELRLRLRAADLEKGRNRLRLQALKDKVIELEAELKVANEDNEKLKKLCERFDDFKSTLARKEVVIKNMKAQLDKAKSDIEELKEINAVAKTEAEKKIRYCAKIYL
jgi:hypothetical protein